MGLMTGVFLLLFAVCFLLVWWNAYRRNTPGVDPLLLMACVLGGLIIPSVNHDYTLPLLTAPFALMVSVEYSRKSPRRLPVILLLILSAFVYATTLVPFLRKPIYLQNNFPLLILLLIITTLLSFLRDKEIARPVIAIQPAQGQ